MTEDSPVEPPLPHSSAPSLAMWITFAALAAAILAVALRKNSVPPQMPQSPLLGLPAPTIRAEGWLNGPGPAEADLVGKIVLIDVWAYWCGPCRAEAPHLVQLYEKYKDRVVFVGLTGEGKNALKYSREFVESTRATWPQGYGALETLEELNANYIPHLYVIDRDGRIVAESFAVEDVEPVLARLTSEPAH